MPGCVLLLLGAGAVAVAAGCPAAGAAPAVPGRPPRPADFTAHVDNPYYPLVPGTTATYRGTRDGQPALDILTVLPATRVVRGVTCRVVRERLFLRGHLAEDTIDWFAQDRAGNVWYFGEATRQLDGRGRVTSTGGSWQAGVRGAREGVFMPARQQVGARYQQEHAKGSAEDWFQVLSTSANVTVPYGAFHGAVQTKEWTPLEPGVVSQKYFVRGVGTVREVDVQGGDERLDLVTVTHR